jgi:predicted anti-sigma-YlaC factor YlaD
MTCDDVMPLLLVEEVSDPRIAAHLAGCVSCRDHAPTLGAVARALAAYPEPTAPAGLGTAVLRAAAPLLARHGRRAAGWRLVRALAAALLPLPLIVLLDVGILTAAYRLLSTVLPQGLSLYLVFNHAALLAFLLALTYGSIPLLAARQGGGLAEESHG